VTEKPNSRLHEDISVHPNMYINAHTKSHMSTQVCDWMERREREGNEGQESLKYSLSTMSQSEIQVNGRAERFRHGELKKNMRVNQDLFDPLL